jgi:adenylosuccinate lyase
VNVYQSPFSWRYGSEDMRRLWSEEHRRRLWRRIWVALAEAQADAGLVTPEQVADLRAHQDDVDLARASEIEAEIGHDVMAEVRTYAEQCPTGGGIIHLGATSADITDNAEVLQQRDALRLVRGRLVAVLSAFAGKMRRHRDLACIAYTHLQPAEPTTLGYRLSLYAQDLLTDLAALDATLGELKGKGLKGAVGTGASYAHLLSQNAVSAGELEAQVMAKLDLDAFRATGQTYPRKQDWRVLNVLAGIAASLHKFAFDLRLLQSPAFGEMAEPFGAKQVGSSAMPFKRNPVNAEKVCSLARFVGGLPNIAWENAALSLLERTLDDSANRRLILAEGFLATDEMLLTAERLVRGLVVDADACRRNLARYSAMAGIEPLLMELVRAGASRQEMHERLRTHSHAASGDDLIAALAADPDLSRYLPPERIRAALSQTEAHVGDAPARCDAIIEQIEERNA